MVKVSLPLVKELEDPSSKAPSIEAMRTRLGGRLDGRTLTVDAGAIVDVETAGGATRTGIALFGDEARLDVLLDRGLVRRTQRDRFRRSSAPAPPGLEKVPDLLRDLVATEEGGTVRFRSDDGSWHPAKLREKCRFGALLERADGTVMGVGWGRLAIGDEP
jgi:hypothetical protein